MDQSETSATEVTDTDRNDDSSVTEQLRPLVPMIPELQEFGIEKKVLKSTKPNETASLFCGLLELQCDCKNLSEETLLPEDSFSLLATAKIVRPWHPEGSTFWWSFIVFVLEIVLLILLLVDATTSSDTFDSKSNPIGVPVNVDWDVRTAQYLSVILMVAHQSDAVLFFVQFTKGFERRANAFKIRFGYNPKKTPEQNEEDGYEGVSADELELPPYMKERWAVHLFCRFLEGNLGNITTFVLIMQQTTVVAVLLNFAALEFISNLDDLAFHLFKLGFFGRQARNDAVKISDATINEGVPIVRCGAKNEKTGLKSCKVPLQFIVACLNVLAFLIAATSVSVKQLTRNEGYRCSQNIINEREYLSAVKTCHQSWPVLLKDREKAERGDLNMVPFIIAIRTEEVDPFGYEWKITSPSNPDKISRAGASPSSPDIEHPCCVKELYFKPDPYFVKINDQPNLTKIQPVPVKNAAYPKLSGVFGIAGIEYEKVFCVPDDFCGEFSIHKVVPTGGGLFEYPGLYKLKSGLGDNYCGGGPIQYDHNKSVVVSPNKTIERFLVGNCKEFLDWKENKYNSFEEDYPNCNVEFKHWIGNGICNDDPEGGYNTEECGYDGGDCRE